MAIRELRRPLLELRAESGVSAGETPLGTGAQEFKSFAASVKATRS